MTEESREAVAERLSALAAPFATIDANQHYWLPQGLHAPAEARLGRTPDLLSTDQREALANWWLAIRRGANTPNWDLATTSAVQGHPGLLDYRPWVAQAADVTVAEPQLRWKTWERRSDHRGQAQNIPLSGLVGTAVLREVPLDLRALLLSGSVVHIGKATVFGYGALRLMPA